MSRTVSDLVSCGTCGAPRRVLEWVEVTTLADAEPQMLHGRIEPCSTPRCGEVCKVCRREPGDVHGPDCGPLMFTKLERPHIVTEEDCR